MQERLRQADVSVKALEQETRERELIALVRDLLRELHPSTADSSIFCRRVVSSAILASTVWGGRNSNIQVKLVSVCNILGF
jgi:hypothetical protein